MSAVQMEKGNVHVTIHEKVTLTIREAAEYSNIGINRIENISPFRYFNN